MSHDLTNGTTFNKVCLTPAPDPTDYGIFAIVIIVGGVVLNHVLHSFERLQVIPYTLSVMLYGMALGGIDIATDKGLAGLSYSMERWLKMDPFVLFRKFILMIPI